MTDTTITASEATGFFTEYAGVRLTELEDGDAIAYGHVSESRFRDALDAYLTETVGEYAIGILKLRHAWAVLRHTAGAAEDEGWYFAWDGVTQDTEGAFPMTVGPAL